MAKKENYREIITIDDKNIEDYSFVLKEKNSNDNDKLYSVKYLPLFLYEKNEYLYGAFTNFKKDENGSLYIRKCYYLKEHSDTFTVKFDLPTAEKEFIDERIDKEEIKELIKKYRNMIKKVEKDNNRVFQLGKEINETKDIDKLIEIIGEYHEIKERIMAFSSLKKLVLANWDMDIIKLTNIIDKNVNVAKNKIDKIKSEKKAIIPAFIVGAFIVFVIIMIFTNNDNSNDNTYDDGYRTNCYVRNDGKTCCVTCKKTSYGDIGCGSSCK